MALWFELRGLFPLNVDPFIILCLTMESLQGNPIISRGFDRGGYVSDIIEV